MLKIKLNDIVQTLDNTVASVHGSQWVTYDNVRGVEYKYLYFKKYQPRLKQTMNKIYTAVYSIHIMLMKVQKSQYKINKLIPKLAICLSYYTASCRAQNNF